MPLFAVYTRCTALALSSTVLSPSAVETQVFVLKNAITLRWRCHVLTLPRSVCHVIAIDTCVMGWVRPVAPRNFCHEANVGDSVDAVGVKSAELEEFCLPFLLPEFPSDEWLSILLKPT